jgi:hypothetical protein
MALRGQVWCGLAGKLKREKQTMKRAREVVIEDQVRDDDALELNVEATQLKRGKTKATAGKPDENRIIIPEMKTGIVQLTVQGISPMIVNKFSAKAEQMMVDKQTGQPKHKRAAKNPEEDYKGSLYPLPGKKNAYGFPAGGFKKAAVSACRYADNINMTYAKGAFHVLGDLIEIKCEDGPKMRRDVVRLNSGPKPVADIRYRGEFTKWSATITVHYNENAISPAMIVNLFNIAGFSVGVGEWRPEKSGSFGMFRVANSQTENA